MSRFFVGGQCQYGGIREVFTYCASRFTALGSNHDQRSIQFFSSFNGTTAYRFGNAQFTVVIVELETAVHHAVGTFADGRHDRNRFQRVFTFCGFTRQHHCVSTVEDGVCNVTGFCASRAWVFDHGIQHLGRSDNDFTCTDTFFDHHLLGEDNFFYRNFYTQVATRNHDAVRGFEDFVEVVEAFLVFDFGDDVDVFAAVRFQVLTDFDNVRTLTNKGSSNKVYALFATKDQVLFVFFSQCWQGNGNARQVHTFVFAQVAVVQHFTDNFVTFNGSNFHTDQTIVNQYGVANRQVSSETFIRYRNHFAVADNRFISGESKGLTRFQRNVVTAFQFHGADFRTFGIKQDSGGFTSFAHHVAQILNALTVFCIVTMREVQTHNVHASVQHFS
ncbi:Uncharacterised protein [Shigella sonnei]|nr:Uncharacterised protein [Shigella sonnei]